MARPKKIKPSLPNAPFGECFWSCDGRISGNLKELRDNLAAMSDEAFAYHCNQEKNDFAVWIAESLKDEKLAKAVRRTKDRKGMIKKIEARLKDFSF